MASAIPLPDNGGNIDNGRSARIKQLDVLRGVAVLLVLGHHKRIAGFLSQGGWCGVDLFFVLSGFLVSGLLFAEFRKTGRLNVMRFLIRRGFKIYPSFYFFLAVTMAGSALMTGKRPPWDGYLSEIFFLQNYRNPVWGHTWSLAVEEHFYLMLAATLFFLFVKKAGSADPFRPMVRIFIAVASTLLLLRFLNFIWRPYAYHTHHYPTHLRIDSLLFGSLLAYFHHFHADATHALVNKHRIGLGAFGMMAVLPPFLFIQEGMVINTFGFVLLYLGFGSLLLLSLHWEGARLKEGLGKIDFIFRPVSVIGFYSYTIYLWHLPVRDYAKKILDMAWRGSIPYPLEVVIYITGSIVVGIVASKMIEWPFLRLRNWLFPSLALSSRAEGRAYPASLEVGTI